MKKRIILVGLLVVAILLGSVSCAKAPSKSEEISVRPMPAPAPMPPIEADTSGVAYQKGTGGAILPSAEERMIVRTGEVSLVVKDVVDARDDIAQLATSLGGYVVSSWFSGEKEGLRGSISIRIPEEKFNQALVELRKLALRVESESTNSQDVTEQYIDLEARLKNAEATEKQYLALLDKAHTVEEILKIYDSLARVRREIEQLKGQMQYLKRTTTMSLLTVQLRPVGTTEPLVPIGWSGWETLKSAIRGIISFGQWLANVAIWLLIFLPIWGTVIGLGYWAWRRRKKTNAGV